jgi:PAS domain S-box-containing protein
MEIALKVVKNIKPRFYGKRFDNSVIIKSLSKIILPIKVADRTLGLIYIISDKPILTNTDERSLIDAMVSAFSLSIDRIYTLIHTQHSKTQSLVESLSDGVIMFNYNKDIVLKNPAFIKYTGLKIKDITLDDFLNSFTSKKLKEFVDQALEWNRISHINEVPLGHKYYEIFVTPVKNNQKKIVGGAVILHDITELRKMDQMKTEFVSVASHQLRTPLTAIKLFTDMLIRGEVGGINKEQKEYLENVHQSTERMVRLVNDLLNVTRIESGRLRIEPQYLDIKSFILNIIAETKPLVQSRKQTIIFNDGNIKLPKIPLDQNLIRQVIHNLIINAVHYSPEQIGKIIVSVNKKGKDNFIISVSDNGIGIPGEVQEKIFKKFYRADNAIKALTEGTGLGLYVSKMIVKSSGGKIWFTSKKNKGATFFVQMPIKGMEKKEGERGLAIS